jgi:hypothetical protein
VITISNADDAAARIVRPSKKPTKDCMATTMTISMTA